MRIRLCWSELFTVRASPDLSLQDILNEHWEVFGEELGAVHGTTVKIFVDRDAQPRFCHAWPVLYAIRTKLDQELKQLQNEGIITPMDFSDWAAPEVPVVKRDGSVHVCGDYKLMVNRVAKTDIYPLPRIEDIFATL